MLSWDTSWLVAQFTMENSSSQAPLLVSSTLLRNRSCQQYIDLTLTHNSHSCSQPVLADTGVDANFIDQALANKLKLGAIPLDAPLSAIPLDGRLLCPITQCTSPVILSFSDSYSY